MPHSARAIPNMEALPGQNSTNSEWPVGKKNAYFACVVAFLLGLFDTIDRQVLASLFPFLKAEYALTDAQLGSLMSVLNIAIAALVIPSGYLIDRWSRKYMIALMGTIWSMATLACAFAGSYSHLLAARFVCGAGEAGYNPAVQSLLSASFPKRLRTTAAGLAQFGLMMGGPVGLVIGAFIATHFGWRHAFGVVAIPGLVISLFALFLKDFKTKRKTNGVNEKPISYAKVLAHMVRTPSTLCIYFGAACGLLYAALLLAWLPSYFTRIANMSITTAGTISAMALFSQGIGVILFAPLVDFFRKYRVNAAALWLMTTMAIASLLAVYIFYFATPGSVPQIGALIVMNLFIGAVPTMGSGMLLDLTAPEERGTAISLLVFAQNIFGMAVGPVLAGFLSDRYGLQMGLVLCGLVLVIALALYTICSITFQRDIKKVAEVHVAFE